MDKYLVTKTVQDKDMTGISVDGKDRKFSKSGHSFYLTDPGEAREVDSLLGPKGEKKVIISKVPVVHKNKFSLRRLGNWKERIKWGK